MSHSCLYSRAARHHHPLARTNLYCLVTEAHSCHSLSYLSHQHCSPSRHIPDVTIATVSSLRRFFHLGLPGANVTTPQSRRAIDVAPPCHAVMRKSMPPPARWLRRAGATANLQSGRKISGQLGAPGAIRPRRS